MVCDTPSSNQFTPWCQLQELAMRAAPVLARWRNKLLSAAWQAFAENASRAQSKRQQGQRALMFWNNRALAGAFAQWQETVAVRVDCIWYSQAALHTPL